MKDLQPYNHIIGITAILLLTVGFVTIGVMTSTAAAEEPKLTCTVGSGAGAVPYVTDNGLTVFENDTNAAIDVFSFPDTETVRFQYHNGGVEISSESEGVARLESGTGDTVCLSSVGTESPILVSPDDKNNVSIQPMGQLDSVAISDIEFDSNVEATDIVFDSGEESSTGISFTVYDTGLAKDTLVRAVDANDRETSWERPVDEQGAVTFAELPVDGLLELDLEAEADPAAVFDVSITDVDESVEAGDQIVVEYTIENIGDLIDTQDIDVIVNETVVETTTGIELDQGETNEQQFVYTTDDDDIPEIVIEISSRNDQAIATVDIDPASQSTTSSSGGSSGGGSSSDDDSDSETEREVTEVTAADSTNDEDEESDDTDDDNENNVRSSSVSASVSGGSTLSISLGLDDIDLDEPEETDESDDTEDDPDETDDEDPDELEDAEDEESEDDEVDDEEALEDDAEDDTEQDPEDDAEDTDEPEVADSDIGERPPPTSQAEVESVDIDVNQDAEADIEIRQSRSPPSEDAREFERDDGTQAAGYVQVNNNLDPEAVDGGRINYRLSKEDLETDDAEPEEVAMYHLNTETDEWEELDTEVVGETDEHVRFRAETAGFSEFASGIKRAQFEVSDAVVDVQEVTLGDTVQVEAIITNTGGADGTFRTELVVDDDVVEDDILTIAANGTRSTLFDHEFIHPDTYEVRVNDVSTGEITVLAPDSTASDETDGTESFIPGFGVGAAVISLLLASLATRRRK